MSWLWGSSEPEKGNVLLEKNDVYADLDPELKAFAKERAGSSDIPIAHDDPLSSAALPQAQFRKENKEPDLSEELQNVINDTKTRKAQINNGAMFNCAEAQYELKRCFSDGSWWDKSKLCELQKGIFWDCLEANRKALTILGYGESGNSKEYDQQLLETADDLVKLHRRNTKDIILTELVFEATILEESGRKGRMIHEPKESFIHNDILSLAIWLDLCCRYTSL